MPTYDYKCEKCGKFTISQGIKEKALNKCPTCGEVVKRLIGKNVNVILKGSGFYSTDNKNTESSNESKAS